MFERLFFRIRLTYLSAHFSQHSFSFPITNISNTSKKIGLFALYVASGFPVTTLKPVEHTWVGYSVGNPVGLGVGASVGIVGLFVGASVGASVGVAVGEAVGASVNRSCTFPEAKGSTSLPKLKAESKSVQDFGTLTY